MVRDASHGTPIPAVGIETSEKGAAGPMVVLRLKRLGRRHRPFYRVNAMDRRAPRDGRVIEELGWFDPIAPEDKQVSLKEDRINYWLSVGAQPSRTVASLLKKNGIEPTSGKKLA
ncbi:MAG: 30S ribosomal protein S16 [Phycisphaerales bacterium]|nr:30S ribosomal protein S16 [Phycisphaerales bacterium]